MSSNSLFCKICANLLSVITSAEVFTFKCNKCQESYQPSEKDTLRYEEIIGSELSIHKTILLNAASDPVNLKVYKNCKCGGKIAKQVRLGSDMKVINICVTCNRKWYESAED